MYKIYINDVPLVLAGAPPADGDAKSPTDQLVARYPGKPKFLLNYIDMLEKSARWKGVTLFWPNPEQLWQDFKSHFKWVEAAGGAVFNPQGEVLLIFRRGCWDLPKGKIDPGESPLEAALREVEEETGLNRLEPGPFLLQTHHTYRSPNGKRFLKRTHWFRMDTDQTTLRLQHEEDIEDAEWVKIEDFLSDNRPTYNSIREVLQHTLESSS
ncbi:MAG: NUDIX hydrolase [Bacteroidetes bacterium]|nr:MAG: NUDIX hydrolase [Bacteroidota bacterium]